MILPAAPRDLSSECGLIIDAGNSVDVAGAEDLGFLGARVRTAGAAKAFAESKDLSAVLCAPVPFQCIAAHIVSVDGGAVLR